MYSCWYGVSSATKWTRMSCSPKSESHRQWNSLSVGTEDLSVFAQCWFSSCSITEKAPGASVQLHKGRLSEIQSSQQFYEIVQRGWKSR